MLKPGQKAPDFHLQSEKGETISLADFEGKSVLIYFFPKADTPG